jgi:hypothetical protein
MSRVGGGSALVVRWQHTRMTTESIPALKRTPIFGGLSIAAPVVLCLMIFSQYVFDSFDLTMLCTVLWPVPMVCGFIFMVVAFIRRERYWAFPFVGLAINLAGIFYLSTHLTNDFHF